MPVMMSVGNKENIPIGTIIWYSANSESIPSGFLYCDGSSLPIEMFENLYKVIGNTYNTEKEKLDNSLTTFRIPDLRGYFIRGYNNNNIGYDSNREFGTQQTDSIKYHIHEGITTNTESITNNNVITGNVTCSKLGSHHHSLEFRTRSDIEINEVHSENSKYVTVLVPNREQYANDTFSINTNSTGNHQHTTKFIGDTHNHKIETNKIYYLDNENNKIENSDTIETRPVNINLTPIIKY